MKSEKRGISYQFCKEINNKKQKTRTFYEKIKKQKPTCFHSQETKPL